MRTKIITKEIMDYFYEKDGWLYWKNSINNHNNKDCLAGFIENNGYRRVTINGVRYQVHRILYQIYNNIILEPNDQIDHINLDKTDNSKENLRLSNNSENNCNKKVQKNNNSTGIKNIGFRETKYNNYYVIFIRKNKKLFQKLYRTDKFTLEDVIKIRDIELERLHGEFMNKG